MSLLSENIGALKSSLLIICSEILKTDGRPDWTFKIVGAFDTPLAKSPSYFGVINYDYLNESRAQNRDTAETFYIKIDDGTKAVATSAAIDRIFANSSHETRTMSFQARAEGQAKRLGPPARVPQR